MAKENKQNVEVKIKELTPEQEAQLEVYYQRYIKVGLSCDTKKEKAEAAIKALYKQEGYPEPEIKWYGSPLAAKKGAKDAGVTDTSFGWEGSFNAGDGAFYAYIREVLGCVEETNEFLPVFDIIDSCGPMVMCDTTVFVSEKPQFIFTDDNGELHNESGPAFSYSDNFCGYYWHGFEVPKDIIERPQDITVKRIKKEENTELRRIMLERFGTGRFVTETGGVIIDEDNHSQDGHRQLVKDSLGNVLFHVGDPSTGRMYWLDMDPKVKTCVEASEFLSAGLDMGKQVGRT